MAYRIVWSDSARERIGKFMEFIAEVIYRIEEPRQTITVVALRHSRQRSLREEET